MRDVPQPTDIGLVCAQISSLMFSSPSTRSFTAVGSICQDRQFTGSVGHSFAFTLNTVLGVLFAVSAYFVKDLGPNREPNLTGRLFISSSIRIWQQTTHTQGVYKLGMITQLFVYYERRGFFFGAGIRYFVFD
jgi:hypothetical protein